MQTLIENHAQKENAALYAQWGPRFIGRNMDYPEHLVGLPEQTNELIRIAERSRL